MSVAMKTVVFIALICAAVLQCGAELVHQVRDGSIVQGLQALAEHEIDV